MTSFAFIFGCLPLCLAAGAGAGARQVMGTTVVAGMLAATAFGIFFIPALFVFMERIAGRKLDDKTAHVPAAESEHPPAEVGHPTH
jgi:Cu/Ag efflux pump CusA